MERLPLTGRCLCGGVRFEITEPPVAAGYCHCTRCQRRTGAGASPNVRLVPGSFRFRQGAELVREWAPEDGWVKAFCGRCGSGLFSRPPEDPSPRAVRMGVLDGDPGLRPQYRQHTASVAPWEPLPADGLPRHEGSARGSA
jgi:hypothetical protein